MVSHGSLLVGDVLRQNQALLLTLHNGELKENPCLIDAIESDVNNALDIIRKADFFMKRQPPSSTRL